MMKRAIQLLSTTAGITLLLLFTGCADTCDVTTIYTYYKPVYVSLQEIRSSVKQEPAQELKNLGKIYYKDGFLFINQPGEGIHLIDNRNPASPVRKSFITIPGNYDLAIQGHTLYADSYIDLVALDIQNFDAIHEISRIENFFSGYNTLGFYVDPERGVITDWVEDKQTSEAKQECDVTLQPWGGYYYREGIMIDQTALFSAKAAIAPGNGGAGIGGSMARFTITQNHLYALDGGSLCPVDITAGQSLTPQQRLYIGWDIETIFPTENNLFIGSSSGMYIIDLENPGTPSLLSTYSHIRSCDPVVVEGNYAYVTLRSGTLCQGFTNQLEVIDIQNLKEPKLVATHLMHNPHGLGIDNTTLFICDGSQGLKVFDASDVQTIGNNLLTHYTSIHAYDVIPFDNVLMMIGDDGLFQYDYTNPKNIFLLSHLPVSNEE